MSEGCYFCKSDEGMSNATVDIVKIQGRERLCHKVCVRDEHIKYLQDRVKELERSISKAIEISDLWLYPEDDCKDERQIVFLIYQSFVDLMKEASKGDS
jgi:hypothetical protein